METRDGFGLRHVSLIRGLKGYGFVIRQWIETAPSIKPTSKFLLTISIRSIQTITFGKTIPVTSVFEH